MKLQHPHVSILVLVVTLLFTLNAPCFGSETKGAATIERIGPEETRMKVQTGAALLVCAYDDNKCEKMLLEGAMLRSQFEVKLPSIPKDQEIIFYCG